MLRHQRRHRFDRALTHLPALFSLHHRHRRQQRLQLQLSPFSLVHLARSVERLHQIAQIHRGTLLFPSLSRGNGLPRGRGVIGGERGVEGRALERLDDFFLEELVDFALLDD